MYVFTLTICGGCIDAVWLSCDEKGGGGARISAPHNFHHPHIPIRRQAFPLG